MTWEVTSVRGDVSGKKLLAEVNRLGREGREPFAVTGQGIGTVSHMVRLRRQIEEES